ncbi:MAG: hypothetical protein ABMA14_12915 [Hyphomonadaceae bacterium]
MLLLKTSAVAAALLCGSAHAQGLVGGRMFECNVLWKGEMRNNGSMGPTDWTDLNKKAFPTFVFDEGSQVLRWKGTELAWQYQIAQAGTDKNDLFALRSMQGAGSYVMDTLRIRTWIDGWPFLLVEGDEVTTGNCRTF